MIRTYFDSKEGVTGTRCEVRGEPKEIYDDFCALLELCSRNPQIMMILNRAANEVQKRKGSYDKDNSGNKD